MNRQCASLRFQHQREIDKFALGDIEATRGEHFPVLRRIRKECPRSRCWHNYKTRSGLGHEVDCVLFVEPREKALHARAKIPNQTWFLELDRGKLRVRLQIRVRFAKKLVGGKKPRNEWGNHQSNRDTDTRRAGSDGSERGAVICSGRGSLPMPRKQEREQRKGRQGIMGQLSANQCEDHKNDRDACQQIVVDFVPAVAGIAHSGLLLSPQLPNQPRQLDRPGKEADEDRYKIER